MEQLSQRMQRATIRRPDRHRVQLRCQAVRQRDFRLIADRIENLSSWGMLVSPAEPVLTGEPLYVSFQLPGNGPWIDAEATVARVVHGRRPTEQARMLGLEFDRLTAFDRFRISRALQALPLTPPSGRPGRRVPDFQIGELLV